MIGHIKIDRKILNWEWYSDYKMVHLFIHLLIKANYKENTWQGVNIKRGQLVTGLHKLSANTGLSVSQIRTCLSKLEMTREIASETTNKYTLITICKYDTYQTENNTNSKHNSNHFSTPDSTPLSTQDSNTIRKQEDKKIFINMPLAENFNGLPELKTGAAIQLLKITKQIDATPDQINGLWNVFKIQHLTGKKHYNDNDDVYSHFINWVKDKKIDIKKTIEQVKTGIIV